MLKAARLRPLAALLSAPLAILAFPSAAIAPLAFIVFVPLLLGIRGLPRGRRFLVGFAAGTLANVGVLHTVAHALHAMGGVSPSIGWLGFLGVSLYLGLEWGLFALFAEPLRLRAPRLQWLTVPTLYAALEFAFPKLFPWYLGSAATPMLAVAQVMDLVGVHGLSWLLVAAQVLVVEAAFRWRDERRAAIRGLVAVAVGALAIVGYGLARLSMIDGAAGGPTLRYAIVQPSYTPDERRSAEGSTMEALGKRTLGLLAKLGPGEVDVVLMGESAFPFPYLSQPEPGSDALPLVKMQKTFAAEARRLRADLVFGAPRFADPKAPPANSIIHMDATGKVRGVYDKMRLVPFSERMPFAWLRSLFPAFEDLHPGASREPFVVGGAKLSPSICYEAIFPEDVRAGGDADVLFNATNDGWFGFEGNASALHLTWQRGRAIELRRPLLRAALSGISAEVAPDGRIVRETKVGTQEILRGTVSAPPLASPFRATGSWWLLGPIVASGVVVVGRSRKRR